MKKEGLGALFFYGRLSSIMGGRDNTGMSNLMKEEGSCDTSDFC